MIFRGNSDIFRRALILALALAPASPFTASPAAADELDPAKINCADRKAQALQIFNDSKLNIPSDYNKARAEFRNRCSISRHETWDQLHDNNRSQCTHGWWNIFNAVQEYGNAVQTGCQTAKQAYRACVAGQPDGSDLQGCQAALLRSAKASLDEARKILNAAVKEAKKTERTATDNFRKYSSAESENLQNASVEQQVLEIASSKFISIASAESTRNNTAASAMNDATIRALFNQGNATSLTIPTQSAGPTLAPEARESAEPTPAASESRPAQDNSVNDALNLGTNSMLFASAGLGLAKTANSSGASSAPGATGAPANGEPAAASGAIAASRGPASASFAGQGAPGAANSAAAEAKSEPAEGKVARGTLPGADGEKKSSSDVGGTSAGTLTGGGTPPPNALPGGAGTGGRGLSAAKASEGTPGEGKKLPDRELSANSVDEGAKGPAYSGSGAMASGGGQGSRAFQGEGPVLATHDSPVLAKLEFSNAPLTDQERELLKLLDGSDQAVAGESPARARELLAERNDPNAVLPESALERGAGALTARGGLAGADSPSLFARVRYAYHRASKRGLILEAPGHL